MITLTHPKHGTHFAYSELEAQTCEKNGWVRDSVKEEQTGVPIVAPQSLEERYKAKFGKSPHHRMKRETIEAALGEDQ